MRTERLTRWLTYQLPRVKQAHPGCPIHQWLNSIGAQVIVEKWQSPEQWPNLYWLPLPDVDGNAQGGLALLPAHLLPADFFIGICGWHDSNQNIASKHTYQHLYFLVHHTFI
ncbi:hypothetical protein O5699_19290 [Escherichia coli]|nr:hypothetical protein [Escherichia coli]